MNLDYILIGLAVLAFIVLMLREVTVWYFKINEIVKLLRAIHVQLVALRQRPPAPDLCPCKGTSFGGQGFQHLGHNRPYKIPIRLAQVAEQPIIEPVRHPVGQGI